jgi:Tfp pilus assembly protein PilN
MTDQLMQDQVGTEAPAETGPPAPLRIAWAPIPKVNLLPIEILEGRRFRSTQVLLAAAVLVVAVLAGAGTFLAQRSVSDANDELVAAQARVTQLQAEQTKYSAVPKVVGQVQAATTARTLAMGSDVLWYRYLNDIDGAVPAGVDLSNITLSLATSASAGVASSPLAAPGIGTIAMNGTADEYDEVSSWLEAINKITGFSSSSLTSAAKADGTVGWSLTAVIDTNALSARYTKDAG